MSPFTFEHFCAALTSSETSRLLAEVFISLLKSALKEEDGNNTLFGYQDAKHTVDIFLYILDGVTWPEVCLCGGMGRKSNLVFLTQILRAFFESDGTVDEHFNVLSIVERTKFPLCSLTDKLTVLQVMVDDFLMTSCIREELAYEGLIKYEDNCRSCQKFVLFFN